MADVNEDIIVEDEDAEEAPASLKTRVVGLVIAAAVLAVLIFGLLHVALPAVVASQSPPKGHYFGSCWVCHMISESAGPADGE